MKTILFLLAVAALAVTGCRSNDDNGMNSNGQYQQNQPSSGTMNGQPYSGGNMNNQ